MQAIPGGAEMLAVASQGEVRKGDGAQSHIGSGIEIDAMQRTVRCQNEQVRTVRVNGASIQDWGTGPWKGSLRVCSPICRLQVAFVNSEQEQTVGWFRSAIRCIVRVAVFTLTIVASIRQARKFLMVGPCLCPAGDRTIPFLAFPPRQMKVLPRGGQSSGGGWRFLSRLAFRHFVPFGLTHGICPLGQN